ncbi:MAG: squalene/phytoene synthase family protein [Pseudomonadota bacterium]
MPGGLDWCRERMLVPGASLNWTLPYADPAVRDPILALRTVISEIASVPDTVSDADVARRKLDWWHEAIDDQLPHPAITALIESGAYAVLPMVDFHALINAVALAIETPQFERLTEWQAYCQRLAEPGALLEAKLVEAFDAADVQSNDASVHAQLSTLAASSYQIRSVRDLVLDARQGRWWLPLKVQAEFQLNREQVAEAQESNALEQVVQQLLERAILLQDKAQQMLPPRSAWIHRHFLLTSRLDRRLAQIIVKRPSVSLNKRVVAVGPLIGLYVWSQARLINKQYKK